MAFHSTASSAFFDARSVRVGLGARATLSHLTFVSLLLTAATNAFADEPVFHVDVRADGEGATLERLEGARVVRKDWFARHLGPGDHGTTYATVFDFSPVCVAPCSADVSSSAVYRIGGDGVTPSRRFSMPGDGAHLLVTAGSSRAHDTGLALLPPGILLFLSGTALTMVAELAHFDDRSSDGALAGGLVTAGIGALVIGLGIYLAASSGTTVMLGDRRPLQVVSQREQPRVRWMGDRLLF
jgi:hypothetical protein